MKYFLSIILLILAACAQSEHVAIPVSDELPEESDVETVPVEAPSVETAPEPVEEPAAQPAVQPPVTTETTEPVVEATPEIPPFETPEVPFRTLLDDFHDTFAENVRGYSFLYNGDEYFVRGTKYKIKLLKHQTVRNADFPSGRQSVYHYDTVYVDRAQETAVAYCEGNEEFINRQCVQLEIKGLAYPVFYEDYEITLPEQWITGYRDISPSKTEQNKFEANGYLVDKVQYALIPPVALYIEPKSGLVLRVEIGTAPTVSRYDYQKLTVNRVKPADVEPQGI